MKRFLEILALTAAFGGAAFAEDVPLRNWSVPAPGSAHLSTLGDVGSPGVFVGMPPCRVVDTRGAAGTYGGPILAAGVPRTFNIVASGCTGIPSSVAAFSLNLTAVTASGNGMLLAWPAGGSQPSISVLNYVTGQTVANAAIVPAGSGNSITVLAGVHATNLLIDINGYFVGGNGSLNTGEQLHLTGQTDDAVLKGTNLKANGVGVEGETYGTSVSFLTAGVWGHAGGATGLSWGVKGDNQSTTDGAAGVYGENWAAGKVYGVKGMIYAPATNSPWHKSGLEIRDPA